VVRKRWQIEKGKRTIRDRAVLSTWHLPIKEGLVRGAEGKGDGWWRVGIHQV